MTQFEIDMKKTINFNGKNIPLGFWNLILSKRDVSLFCVGIKPTRGWRFNAVKDYFGMSGNKQSVKKQLEELHAKFIH